MPRIKRWFPVAQDINGDSETWLLTDMFGDRSIRIWLEVLSITDKTENRWHLAQGWLGPFSRKVRLSKGTVIRVMEFFLMKRWLHVMSSPDAEWNMLKDRLADGWPTTGEGLAEYSSMVRRLLADPQPTTGQGSTDHHPVVLGTRNYSEYHRTRETKGKRIGSPPNRTEPNRTEPDTYMRDGEFELEHPPSPKPSLFEKFWSAYPNKVGKAKAVEKWNKLSVDEALLAVILKAVERQKLSRRWQESNGEYIPHPATWLYQERWNDELPTGAKPLLRPDVALAQRRAAAQGEKK